MNNQKLDDAVSRWHCDAEPPAALRIRVLNATDAGVNEVPAPAPTRRRVLWATGAAVATACASVMIFAVASTPTLPAYAQVLEASTDVKTVQWDEEFSQYDARTGKVIHVVSQTRANLELPAVRRDGVDFMGIITAEWHMWNVVNNRGKWETGRKPEPKRSNLSPMYIKNPAERLRWSTEEDIMPPKMTDSDNPNLSTVMEVTEFGRPLLRYDAQNGRKFHGPGKMTTTGARRTVWADPQTHRAVRTRFEYYNGEAHMILTKSNFRYDEPLDDALFDTSRPQETLMK